MKKKVSKKSVDYRLASGKRHCESCAMFHPRTRSCDLVEGTISPVSVCDRWVAK